MDERLKSEKENRVFDFITTRLMLWLLVFVVGLYVIYHFFPYRGR